MVTVPGPAGERGEPGPPGVGLPGKAVSQLCPLGWTRGLRDCGGWLEGVSIAVRRCTDAAEMAMKELTPRPALSPGLCGAGCRGQDTLGPCMHHINTFYKWEGDGAPS